MPREAKKWGVVVKPDGGWITEPAKRRIVRHGIVVVKAKQQAENFFTNSRLHEKIQELQKTGRLRGEQQIGGGKISAWHDKNLFVINMFHPFHRIPSAANPYVELYGHGIASFVREKMAEHAKSSGFGYRIKNGKYPHKMVREHLSRIGMDERTEYDLDEYLDKVRAYRRKHGS